MKQYTLDLFLSTYTTVKLECPQQFSFDYMYTLYVRSILNNYFSIIQAQ